ncbi:MAG: hypothetical protein HQL66_08510 [Magnetococcales bacterium]|nr:hypothetical protein [Magnetococcales bacterium]
MNNSFQRQFIDSGLLSRWIVLGVIILGIGRIWAGHVIPQGHGLGWDGELIYLTIIKEFPVERHQISHFFIQRSLPFAIAHYAMQALGWPFLAKQIVLFFQLFNLTLTLLSLLIWRWLADRVGLGTQGRLLGYVALAISFCNMLMPLYNPVLTDILAFFLSMLLLFFYLTGHVFSMFLVIAAGAFTWPTILPIGAILFLFPKAESALIGNSAPLTFQDKITPRLLLLIGTVVIVTILFSHNFVPLQEHKRDLLEAGANVIVSISIFIYLYVSVPDLVVNCARQFFYFIMDTNKRRLLARLFILAAFFGGVKMFSNYWGHQNEHREFFGWYLFDIFVKNNGRPLLFILNHFLYFGPIVVVAGFLWRRVIIKAAGLGPGMALVAFFVVLQVIDTQSRREIGNLPFIVLFTAMAFDEIGGGGKRFWMFFLLLSFLTTKLFVPFELDFPTLFFTSGGRYMAFKWYVIQLCLMLPSAYFLWRLFHVDDASRQANVTNPAGRTQP